MHRTLITVWLLATIAGCSRSGRQPADVKGGSGELRVLLPYAPASLNPDIARDEPSVLVGSNLFNQLITIDADGNVIPDLARQWEVGADNLTYTFHLASGIRWHDMAPLSSDDVKWTLEAIARSEGFGREIASRIARVEAPEAQTVVVHLKEPWAPFLSELASFGTFILPKHVYARGDLVENPANDRPIGTGPFRFSSWDEAGRINLTANRDYWKRGPYIDRLTFIVAGGEGPSSAEEAFGDHAVDVTLLEPEVASLAALDRSPDLVVRTSPSEIRYQCVFNIAKRPFDDVRVRRAINMSLDRRRLVEEGLRGYGIPALGYYTPMVEWAYNADASVPPLDRSAARRLLDQAGLKPGRKGQRFAASLLAPSTPPYPTLARAIAEDLAAIGIRLTVDVSAASDTISRLTAGKLDFDLAVVGGLEGPDPDSLRTMFGPASFIGYRSDRFERAMLAGATAVDPDRRARAYFEAQAILAEDQPIAPIAEDVRVTVYRKGVIGLPQAEARGLVASSDFSLVRFAR